MSAHGLGGANIRAYADFFLKTNTTLISLFMYEVHCEGRLINIYSKSIKTFKKLSVVAFEK